MLNGFAVKTISRGGNKSLIVALKTGTKKGQLRKQPTLHIILKKPFMAL